MSFCAGKEEKCWVINYIIPRPKIIRYKYPRENWQEIAGDRFTIDQIPDRILATYRPRWLSIVTCRMNIDGHIPAGSLQDVGAWIIPNPFYVPFSPSPTFTGIYLRWEWLNPFTNNGNATYGNFGVRIFYLNNQNVETSVDLLPDSSSNNYAFWFFTCISRRIDQMSLIAENPVTIPGNCRFKVFNCSNQVILDITNTVCPEVEVIDCQFTPNDLKTIKITPKDREVLINLPGFLTKLPFTRDKQKCVKVVLLRLVANPFTERFFEILEICSPPCCQKEPFVEIECESDCGCERCPDSYCFACLNGNEVCCYGGDGTVIKRIPLDKLCKDQKIC
jgi:hypothetical protein